MNYHQAEITNQGSVEIENHLPKIGLQKVQEEILGGLKSSGKYISSKFFYDQKGSELFEEITKLAEYYPTRTEKKILEEIGQNLDVNFNKLNIIELGSGDHTKISLLLRQIPKELLSTISYLPVDISQSALETASSNLAVEFPMVKMQGIVADFIHQLNLIPKIDNRLFCFFGSTIGNLSNSEVEQFMRMIGEEMTEGESFILGIDMTKDISILEKAYNDSLGITAKFNKNILSVINKLIDSDFDPKNFEHLAFYNKEMSRIEMHLEAKKDMSIHIGCSSEVIHISEGETIHTENSHKFNHNIINTLGSWAGIETKKIITDSKKWFSLVHYKK